MRFLEAGDPAGPLLVLVHGGGVGPWMWARQLSGLADGFHVVAPVLPGHDPEEASVFTTHGDASGRLAELIGPRRNGLPVTVAGFSLGGQTALQLAADHPHLVDRLVVVSSLAAPYPLAPLMRPLMVAAAPLVRCRAFARAQARQLSIPPELFGDYDRTARSISPVSLSNIAAANFRFRVPAVLPASPRPTLLLAGAREPKVLLRGFEALRRQLPEATLEVLPGIGHGLPLQDPGLFDLLLRQWLARLPPRRTGVQP